MDIRPLNIADADALVPLCHQLGYPATREEIIDRLRSLLANEEDGVFGAVLSTAVVGWVHVQSRFLLERDAAAEICSLVVAESHRGRGCGRALMAHAEAWARERGYREVFLRSNITRIETHAFYRAIGYTSAKTSHVFAKALAAAPDGGA